MIGRTLSHYKVLEKIGEGGMGEVYLAKDTKLDREVAVKVLPAIFSENKERLARFEREARLLASLNHPNIAAIHELEESDGLHFLALEYVPGETLAERIKRGAIPVDEALPLFKQIAEALEAAHENGVIHRDLKPANIKVTPEGKVKVLDFGLAKAMAGEIPPQQLSESPTITRDATESGVLLGTAPYMSPEQARGKAVDKRTDIWAFGCCLYEALTGKTAFLGDTVTDTIAKIVEREPDWRTLPHNTPTMVRFLLRRCLEKDSRKRLRDAAHVGIELDDAATEPLTEVSGQPATTPWERRTLVLMSVLLALSMSVALWSLLGQRSRGSRGFKSYVFSLSFSPTLETLRQGVLAVSPDGTRLVYADERNGTSQLFVRPMDQLEATPIPGTEGGVSPFFAPDGQWVGFFAEGKLKKVSLLGGAPLTLCDAQYGGGSWSSDDTIWFTPSSSAGLHRVSAAGGLPQEVTTPNVDTDERSHRWPELLPDDKSLLFTLVSKDDVGTAIQSLETGERRTLIEGGFSARYVPTGHLVYAVASYPMIGPSSLHAVPFDLDRLELTGPSVQIVDGIRGDPTVDSPFSFSSDGLLVYVPFVERPEQTLLLVDRSGIARPLTDERRPFMWPRFSPNGQRLGLTVQEGKDRDVWVYELNRDMLTRMTFEGWNYGAVWTRDGKWLTFGAYPEGKERVYWMPADGSDSPIYLTEGFPNSWSPDSQVLLLGREDPITASDMWIFQLDDESNTKPFLRTDVSEGNGRFSPDGRWLAYQSLELGRAEVYVRPFSGSGRRWQISTEGGREPVWAPSGRELFYRNGKKLMVVDVSNEPTFAVSKPRLLFEKDFVARIRGDNLGGTNYDIAPDGQHFIMLESSEQSMPTQINVVLNWFEELKRLVPTN